ncbi:GNAT family N-acetyltransferase [Roseomonas sp. CCTCC AB2023176]|uniref:GNAT family N-acetyltransferase n=1 Tax=Roseomonas sp. CCTCC AB2023176 TaxID=3342640 RepID=UPI0035E05529
MIQIRRARPDDAAAMGAVHVASWRDTYAGILPDAYLTTLSAARIAAAYRRSMIERARGDASFVACLPAGGEVVGFGTTGRARRPGMGEGEIETLYLLPDWRDQGIGRRLMRAAAAHLGAVGFHSVFLWVLSANNAGWFYRRLGGRLVARETIRVAGQAVEQSAVIWDPVALLLEATAQPRAT